jgi:hypothetical protein
MIDLLRGGRLGLPDDDELLDELRGVRLVERTPGVYRLDHAPGKHDDRAIAVALAAQHLLRRRKSGVPTVTRDHPWSPGFRGRHTKAEPKPAPGSRLAEVVAAFDAWRPDLPARKDTPSNG